MTLPAAFRATYSDWKLVKTRGVVQIVFEVPLAESDAAYDVVGGMPDVSKERWFGIAAIQVPQAKEASARPDQIAPKPDRAKQTYRDMAPANQAGIRCDDPVFIAFLKEQRSQDWREAPEAAQCVRLICGVKSRAEFGTNHAARVMWHQLDEQFGAWKALEHA